MSSGWQGKSTGRKSGYQIFVWLIRHAGLLPAYLLLRFVALYYFLFSAASSGPVLGLYRRRLGMSLFAAWSTMYRNYYCFGQTLIDKVAATAGYGGRFRQRAEGLENLQSMSQSGSGGLLLSAHMGNWEIAGFFLQKLGIRISLVMYDGERSEIKNYLDGVTGEKPFQIITIRPDGSHIFRITAALAAGELVCMHADRYLAGNKTLDISFLGAVAKFPEGPFVIGAKLNAPVSFVFAFKEGTFGYYFSASPPISAGAQELAEKYARVLETQVRNRPEQWFNYYDFWQ